MRTGFIKWYSSEKRYGFIRFYDGSRSWREIFFHRTNVNFTPKDGDFVSFSLRDGWKGLQAVNVQRKKKTGELV